MGLEAATLIHELDPANPVGAVDGKGQGDDHIRMIKQSILNTFPNIEDVVNASHSELNILDGATLSTAELNILDGVTATAAELNILDGVTASAAELNKLDGATVTTAELNILDGVTAVAADLDKTKLLDSSTYTPTLVALANCAASGGTNTYSRNGILVTVIGSASITVTAPGAVLFAIPLPIASNLTASNQLVGFAATGNDSETAFLISGDSTNNRAVVGYETTDTGPMTVFFNFSYRVL